MAPLPQAPSSPGDELGPSTMAVHGGRRPTPGDPDVSPPLRRSSTFLQHPGTHAATDSGDWTTPLVYTRYRNPNVEDAERRIAALERAEAAALFASGMAAIHALLMWAAPKGRGRIAVARQIYGGTTALFDQVLGGEVGLDIEALGFDVTDAEELDRILEAGDVSLVHVEGLSNPTSVVADLPRIVRQAHARGVRVSVDSTFATPIVQKPLKLGVDLVVHSATKALSGHSDVTAGVVCGSAEALGKIAQYRKVSGAILDPSAAWLLTRSLATLDLRVRAQCRNAAAIAEALEQEGGDLVRRVHYPGLTSSPSHALAKEVLAPGLFGSMLAFELSAGDEAVRDYVARLRLAIDAPSLGGVETLVSLPVFMSHVGLTSEQRLAAGIGPGCVRVAAGIEDAADLVADFVQALR
ncbi:MAG: aminotransferase class V-fold PLP-dependent enzyme [Planctomycetota bacterium]